MGQIENFPSDEFLEQNYLPPLMVRVYDAVRNTLYRNYASYTQGIPLVGSDVALSDGLTSGRIRRSFNPVRWLIGFPFVFSYSYALRNEAAASVHLRQARARVQREVLHIPRRVLRLTVETDDHARVCLVKANAVCLYTSKHSIFMPSPLADELRELAKSMGSTPVLRWCRFEIEDNSVYLVAIPEVIKRERPLRNFITPGFVASEEPDD